MSKAALMVSFGLAFTASGWAGLSRLEAIGMIESGNNDRAVGRAGEVSRYQIKPSVWQQYSRTPAYRNVTVSAQVAEKYLASLEANFRARTGRAPGDFDLYVLWNAGPAYYQRIGFSSGRVHRVIRERADRFVNLRQMETEDETPAPRPILAASSAGAR